MTENDTVSIILGGHFLNTTCAVINCNKGKIIFNVNDKEHTIYFPKKVNKVFRVNTRTIKVESIDCSIYDHQE